MTEGSACENVAEDLHRLANVVEAVSGNLAREVRTLTAEQSRKVEALQVASISEHRYQRLFQLVALLLLLVLIVGVLVSISVQRDSRENNRAVRECTTPLRSCYEQALSHAVIVNWCSLHTKTLAATQTCVRNVRTYPVAMPTGEPTVDPDTGQPTGVNPSAPTR